MAMTVFCEGTLAKSKQKYGNKSDIWNGRKKQD